MIPRRSFLQATVGTGALAALGDLGFLARLPRVLAEDAVLDPKVVRFESGIEPLVRITGETVVQILAKESLANMAAPIHG